MSFQSIKTISTEDKNLLFYCGFFVESHTSKKNRKKIFKNSKGQSFIGNEEKTTADLEFMKMGILSAKNKQLIVEPIHYYLRAVFKFHYPLTQKGKLPKKVMDLSNLIQGPEDCLTKTGVIINDRLIESYDGSCRVYGAPHHYLEIALYRHHPELN